MSQKVKIIVAFLVSILFLILVGIFSFKSISDYKDSSKWVNHTQEVIAETQQILSYCQDIETTNRGFAITRRENHLVPFNKAVAKIPIELKKLKKLTSNNPYQQHLTEMLEMEVQQKIDFGRKVNEVCRKYGIKEAQKLIIKDTGKVIMDHIRSHVSQIIDNENSLLDIREKRTTNSFESTIAFIAAGSIFSVVVIIFSLFIFIRDFNSRVKIEKEIKESEFKLKQFLNALPVGIHIMSNEFKSYYANKMAEDILGSAVNNNADVTTGTYPVFEKGTDNPYPMEKAPVTRVLGGEAHVVSEDIEVHHGQRRIPIRVSASSVKDSEGIITYGISVIEDITDQKNAERELIRARQLAEESSLLKEVFLANMSHEIRTPMNAIIGFATLLKDTELDLDQKEFVTNISTASENLLGIINDILDISKIESGHIILEEISFSLEKTIKNVSAIMQHKAAESKINLNYRIDENVPPYIMGDPTRLNQVLLNLTNNAIKFTEVGEVNIIAELENETENDVTLKFSVKDTGIGIPAVKLDSIFERFAQADSNTTRIYGGTGLGLSICKSLVELQHGTIGVESTPKVGSTFFFKLTFRKVKQEAREKIESKLEHFKVNKSVKLLLVEDNVLNQKLALKVLQNFGFITDLAENGKVAVEKVQQNHYDVILMDLQMPEMDGYQATEFIRQNLKIETPIIAMTAHSLVGEKDKCMSIGMNDYIPKPFSPGILYEKILNFSKPESEISGEKMETVHSNDLVNLSYLKELSGGSEEFEKEMIELYLTQTPIELEILQKAITETNYQDIKATAHKLKSSFSLMGVNENGILPWMEKEAVMKSDIAVFSTKFAELDAIYQQSREILGAEL